MDTAAYLANQGWRGDGHALHHSGRGIVKPLLISQKQNVLGIGKKKHDAHADQWWLRAFDATLKGINCTKDEATGKAESVSLGAGAQALQMVGTGGGKWVGQRGLYSKFVRGEGLHGTLNSEEETKSGVDGQRKASEDDESSKSKGSAAHKGGHALQSLCQRNQSASASERLKSGADKKNRKEARSRQTADQVDQQVTKEERRRRKKERRAQGISKDNARIETLRETDRHKDSGSKKSKRRKEDKPDTAVEAVPALSEGIVPSSSEIKPTNRKKRKRETTEDL